LSLVSKNSNLARAAVLKSIANPPLPQEADEKEVSRIPDAIPPQGNDMNINSKRVF
jgi:hypothetical protein